MSNGPGKHKEPDILPVKKSLLVLAKEIRLSPAFLGAVALAGIGWFTDRALQRHEEASLKAQQQQDKVNLYTQLIAQREQSASALRMDMFESMITSFFQQRKIEKDLAGLSDERRYNYWANFFSKRVLQLEMLAVNFGEVMSMSPLFQELRSEIEQALDDGEIEFVEGNQEIERLEELARRVSSWQLAALPQGNQKSFMLRWNPPPPTSWDTSTSYKWPLDQNQGFESVSDLKNNFEEHFVTRTSTSDFSAWNEQATDNRPANTQAQVDTQPEVDEIKPSRRLAFLGTRGERPSLRSRSRESSYREVKFDGVTRHITVVLSDPKEELKKVTATVTIKMKGVKKQPVPLRFDLDFFQFPMIDNIRLSHDHRLALVMTRFDTVDDPRIEVALVIFPGKYGSQRDKPFLDVVMQQLPNIRENPDFSQGNKP